VNLIGEKRGENSAQTALVSAKWCGFYIGYNNNIVAAAANANVANS
jgi:hypothetical protein